MGVIINKAKSQVGKGGKTYWEYGVGTRYVNGDTTPWCGAFVFWVVNKVGGYTYMTKKESPFYVPNINAWGKKKKLTVSKANARADDIVTFTWGHVGFVYKNHGDGSYTTIEGNTGGDSKVYMRTRYASQIERIIRLKKKTEKKTDTATKKASNTSAQKTTKTASKPTTTAHKATYKVVTKDGLNIRAEYRVGSKKKGAIPYGTKVSVTKKHDTWVYAPKYKGWLCIKKGNETYLKKV